MQSVCLRRLLIPPGLSLGVSFASCVCVCHLLSLLVPLSACCVVYPSTLRLFRCLLVFGLTVCPHQVRPAKFLFIAVRCFTLFLADNCFCCLFMYNSASRVHFIHSCRLADGLGHIRICSLATYPVFVLLHILNNITATCRRRFFIRAHFISCRVSRSVFIFSPIQSLQ